MRIYWAYVDPTKQKGLLKTLGRGHFHTDLFIDLSPLTLYSYFSTVQAEKHALEDEASAQLSNETVNSSSS